MNGIVLHLMRHGEPREPGLLLGHRDDPPLPSGTARCVLRADGLDFAQVLSSDLSRSQVPARQIAGQRKLPHRSDRRWRELDFGEWDGMAPHELDPAVQTRFWDDPEGSAPPGGERWSQLRNRIAEALRGIDRATLVVTHAGAMRAVLSVLFGFDHRQVWAFELGYSALLSLRLWPETGGRLPAAQIVSLDRGSA
ncbi:alpha-ribazole phosphatase [Novosphingobium sp. PhB165]|uniref:histidine phosphatase family protein n=1 Tax=Novosphingobium sp. PhB165 TaxID=2485105 RepID=UPI00104AB785|nr:histidine phosphatase family protein [Novosphingobium sp. PhB165]TCM17683.1 alpha-ribazole phosphatase [Novosphingobium sp. PhB165]